MSFDILVVTGLPYEAVLVRRLLEQQGFHVLPVSSAAEARRKLRSSAFDAIIVDEHFP